MTGLIFLLIGIFVIAVSVRYILNVLDGYHCHENLLRPYIILVSVHIIWLIILRAVFPFSAGGNYFSVVDIFIPSGEIRDELCYVLTGPRGGRGSMGGRGTPWTIFLADVRYVFGVLLSFHIHLYSIIFGALAIVGIVRHRES